MLDQRGLSQGQGYTRSRNVSVAIASHAEMNYSFAVTSLCYYVTGLYVFVSSNEHALRAAECAAEHVAHRAADGQPQHRTNCAAVQSAVEPALFQALAAADRCAHIAAIHAAVHAAGSESNGAAILAADEHADEPALRPASGSPHNHTDGAAVGAAHSAAIPRTNFSTDWHAVISAHRTAIPGAHFSTICAAVSTAHRSTFYNTVVEPHLAADDAAHFQVDYVSLEPAVRSALSAAQQLSVHAHGGAHCSTITAAFSDAFDGALLAAYGAAVSEPNGDAVVAALCAALHAADRPPFRWTHLPSDGDSLCAAQLHAHRATLRTASQRTHLLPLAAAHGGAIDGAVSHSECAADDAAVRPHLAAHPRAHRVSGAHVGAHLEPPH